MKSRISLLVGLLLLPAGALIAQSRQTLTHEVLWSFQRVGAPTPSPDGRWVVFSVAEFSYTGLQVPEKASTATLFANWESAIDPPEVVRIDAASGTKQVLMSFDEVSVVFPGDGYRRQRSLEIARDQGTGRSMPETASEVQRIRSC